MEDVDRNLLEWNKWNIPTERTDKIYRQTTFSKLSFLTDYTIKTIERTYSLFNEYETIQLFTLDSINWHREKYAFLHVGLVQVAIKPLTRQYIVLGNIPSTIYLWLDLILLLMTLNFPKYLSQVDDISNVCNSDHYLDVTAFLFTYGLVFYLTCCLKKWGND